LHVFIDEIQKIPDLFQALQGLYDNYKGRIKFWIWGSSARPLKRRRAETLSGRVISRILFPLSQNEIRKNDSLTAQLLNLPKGVKSISYSIPPDYITFLKKCFGQSLLPEPFLTRDKDAVYDLLDTYKASYLENEIRRENLVSDIGIFSRFLTIAASEDTEVLNYNSVAKDLGISSHTVKTYHGILEDTFVTSQLTPYINRMRMQVCKSSKVYFTDTGLARFVSGQSNTTYMQTKALGKCFEGFVINEIIKQVEYQSLRWKLSFFRTKNGREADLIISDGQKKCAVEIKAKKKITTSDFKNLKCHVVLEV
jgi:predicted AAA+ superfamily ATPase